jgi:hypothetical protein
VIKTISLAAPALAAALWPGLGGIAIAQSPDIGRPQSSSVLASAPDRDGGLSSSSADSVDSVSYTAGDPAAAGPAGRREQPGSTADMIEGWPPLSRIAVGTGAGPLGIGIRGATVLTEYFDARIDGNFFSYKPKFQINGFDAVTNFHLASIGAKLDWYPTNSVWRISPGIMFYNGNQFSALLTADAGTSFDINGKTYYSADPNKVSGATPVSGTVALGLNRNKPAFTLTGGFGRFIPRSHRHWSFPGEFGVAFTGAPTLDIKLSGWVCTDKKELNCSDLTNPANPVAIQFNNSLNTALARWRRSLSSVTVYPIFSTGVMYSFDIK